MPEGRAGAGETWEKEVEYLVTSARVGPVRLVLANSAPGAVVGAVKFADGQCVLAFPGVLSVHSNVPQACTSIEPQNFRKGLLISRDSQVPFLVSMQLPDVNANRESDTFISLYEEH